ncbi:MAG TPA: hypothetical protein VF444_03230 [Pseudonocardiaceae bacterium]
MTNSPGTDQHLTEQAQAEQPQPEQQPTQQLPTEPPPELQETEQPEPTGQDGGRRTRNTTIGMIWTVLLILSIVFTIATGGIGAIALGIVILAGIVLLIANRVSHGR